MYLRFNWNWSSWKRGVCWTLSMSISLLQRLVRLMVRSARRVKLPISTLWGRRGKPRKWILLLLAFICNLLGRSLIGFVTCIGFRVAPQVILVTFPGLSCFYFGSLTVAVCRLLRLTASGCVWVSMRMLSVVSRRRMRFFVRGVGLFPLSFALVVWPRGMLLIPAARQLIWGLASLCLGSRGGLGCLWLSGVICLFSFLLSLVALVAPSPCLVGVFGGLMARNPASYVSSLTWTWDECARAFIVGG